MVTQHLRHRFGTRVGLPESAAGAAGLSLGLAGLLHLFQAPMHLDHAWEHAGALATVGVLDLAWTVAWLGTRHHRLVFVGWFLATQTLTLYAISRFLPLPFEGSPEEVNALNLLTQLFELVGLLSLTGASLLSGPGLARTVRPLAITCALAVVAGWLVFGAATWAAAMFQQGGMS